MLLRHSQSRQARDLQPWQQTGGIANPNYQNHAFKMRTFVMLTRVIVFSCMLIGGMTAPVSMAQEAAKAPNYKDDVLPIFNARCNSCHNPDKKKGGLLLDNFAGMMQGGGSGKVIEPGDPDNSRLYLLTAHEEKPEMPPSAPKIADAEIAVIRKWIEGGALETSGSTAMVKAKPKVEFKLDPSSIGKPQGEPAMPVSLATEPVVTSPRPNAITALAHSPWAPLAAVAGHKQVLLYNTQTQQLIGVLPFPEGIIEVLKFTLDGDLLLAGGGRGGQSGRVVVWDVKTGERLFEVGKEYDTVLGADISPDRSMVALGGPSKVLRVYNSADGELIYECKKHTEWVTAVAFSPDGVLLASGDRNGGLIVWEAPTGREFYDLRNHTALISDLSWRLDSNILASGSEDSQIRLWEMEKGTQVKNWAAHPGGLESVKFAKDGRLVSTGRDRVTKVWDQNGAEKKKFAPFPDVATRAVFNHDDTLIIAGDYSGQVRVHELTEGKQIGALSANPLPVAARLEQLPATIALAKTEAEKAVQAIAPLMEQVKAQQAAVAKAQEGVEAANKLADEALAAVTGAEAALPQKVAAEQESMKQAAAAEDTRAKTVVLRDKAFQDLKAKTDAAAKAAEVFAASKKTDADKNALTQATQARDTAIRELDAALPAWNTAIEASAQAKLALEQATSARLMLEARIPALKLAQAGAAGGVDAAKAAVTATQTAQQNAEKAVATATAAAEAAKAKVPMLEAELERLKAEKEKLTAAK